jgi:hypothetical protein
MTEFSSSEVDEIFHDSFSTPCHHDSVGQKEQQQQQQQQQASSTTSPPVTSTTAVIRKTRRGPLNLHDASELLIGVCQVLLSLFLADKAIGRFLHEQNDKKTKKKRQKQ